jgi:hypothetical protein
LFITISQSRSNAAVNSQTVHARTLSIEIAPRAGMSSQVQSGPYAVHSSGFAKHGHANSELVIDTNAINHYPAMLPESRDHAGDAVDRTRAGL